MQSTGNFRHPKRWNSVVVPERVAERAYTRISHIEDDGCKISSYSVANHGYAQVGWSANGKSQMVLAHRAAWVHVNGQVPLGMTLDHICKNKRCVNTDHLRMLPNFENARRTNGDDWELGYCRNGHSSEHLGEVARRTKAGERRFGVECKLCKKEHWRKYRKENREMMNEKQ